MTASPQADLEITLLLEAIFERFHYDFRAYSKASLKRRLMQAVSHFGVRTVSDLQGKVLHEDGAFTRLLAFLTVQVSDMFRDPAFFKLLREQIVPILRTYPSLRVWCAGCAEGEEVYSLAILLHEEGLLERTTLYATDVNPNALRKAEAGVYPLDRIAVFSENHRLSGAKCSLSEYYTAGYGAAVFDRKLIRGAVFADHSLATDNVFAEVQLITCRNVLIYFDKTLQNRAIDLFTEALSRRGFFGMGSKETLSLTRHANSFEPFSPSDKWYRKW